MNKTGEITMNTNYNNVNFSSTHVPAKSAFKAIDTIAPYFELKGINTNSLNRTRKSLNGSQAGISLEKDGLKFVGKDREADSFISRMLKKNNIESNYVQDTPETKFEGDIIDFNI